MKFSNIALIAVVFSIIFSPVSSIEETQVDRVAHSMQVETKFSTSSNSGTMIGSVPTR